VFKLLAQSELFFESVIQKPTSLCFHKHVQREYANHVHEIKWASRTV